MYYWGDKGPFRWFLIAAPSGARVLYLCCVVSLLLALYSSFTGAGLLSELFQTSLQLQLFLTGLVELPHLLAVHRLQFAAKLPLLCAQFP